MKVSVVICEGLLQIRLEAESPKELEKIVEEFKVNKIDFKRYTPHGFPFTNKNFELYYRTFHNHVVYLDLTNITEE